MAQDDAGPALEHASSVPSRTAGPRGYADRVKHRTAIWLVLGFALVSVPAAAAARFPTSPAPITRFLCGCDLQGDMRAATATVSARFSTVSMSIVHVVRGCHVWTLGSRHLGPVARIDVKVGTRLKLRIDCPMDFDLTQVAGPRLALGGRRFYTGSTRVIVFRKVGVYKFVAQNVQTSAEAGLATLGTDNVPRLTIRVR